MIQRQFRVFIGNSAILITFRDMDSLLIHTFIAKRTKEKKGGRLPEDDNAPWRLCYVDTICFILAEFLVVAAV